MKNRDKNPVIQYYLLILLSVIDLIGAIGFAVLALLSLVSQTTGSQSTGFQTFNTIQSGVTFQFSLTSLPVWLDVILSGICFALQPVLAIKRQAYRDEVEYDENGVNRKRGQFSQLSRKEREAIDQQKMMDAERILSATTFKSILHEGSKNCHKDLNKLVGLKNVKERISEMEARMAYEQQAMIDQKKKKKTERTETLSSMHMIFSGEPGTGKTTVARIMTGLLHEYGYIEKNQCVEIDGNFFNGLSVGEASKRASMLVAKSKGGVIFIDEAYALLSGGGGQEVIATLVKAMEDNRDELVFIFAGYEKEMKDLVDSNPGIESRVKHHLAFGGYTLNDMKQIFTSMAHEKNLLVSSELLEKFSNEIMYLKSQPNFGNARTVRNLLDRIIDQHAINLRNKVVSEEDRYKLKSCDFPKM